MTRVAAFGEMPASGDRSHAGSDVWEAWQEFQPIAYLPVLLTLPGTPVQGPYAWDSDVAPETPGPYLEWLPTPEDSPRGWSEWSADVDRALSWGTGISTATSAESLGAVSSPATTASSAEAGASPGPRTPARRFPGPPQATPPGSPRLALALSGEILWRECPAPLVVRNTFIEAQLEAPLAQRHRGLRRALSCPATPPAPGAAVAAMAVATGVGSARHGVRGPGRCKPCAFVHTEEGCANGVECAFCHACDPGEKKRRQKEKSDRKRRLWRSRQQG
eukprot:CAMPEP_0179024138 /NCGR_PEP_ID=MMETSP0796-20121207/7301_1 /TAXON_ID=73915 /ORGANISM="Pyrodinium bahamense, Strain pbaha01" /LENGTH=275 /DNA_ID=CAMNT_0020720091 /DNA_START=17 /DNA_END=844 /DNA_ORIENTATION=-